MRYLQCVSAMLLLVLPLGCADPCESPESEAILAAAAMEEGAIRTESGLVFLQLRPGSGPTPGMTPHPVSARASASATIVALRRITHLRFRR